MMVENKRQAGKLRDDVQEQAPSSRTDRKADAILLAARQHFYRDGYGSTSVEAIGQMAGIGKATIYKYFGSKENLFSAVVEKENQQGLYEVVSIMKESDSPKNRLNKAGRKLLDILISPDFIASYRMVMAESTRFPSVATRYYEGAVLLLDALSHGLSTMMEEGDLIPGDPRRAAEQFVGLIRGDLQLRAMLGFTAPVKAARHAIVSDGVDVFYRFYGLASE